MPLSIYYTCPYLTEHAGTIHKCNHIKVLLSKNKLFAKVTLSLHVVASDRLCLEKKCFKLCFLLKICYVIWPRSDLRFQIHQNRVRHEFFLPIYSDVCNNSL